MPKQMGGLMIYFISNLLPYMIMVWALSLTLFYRTLFLEEYNSDHNLTFNHILPALIVLLVVIVFIILPIRTCINKCIKPDAPLDVSYWNAFESFITDYDTENPVTKKEGMIRKLQMRIQKN